MENMKLFVGTDYRKVPGMTTLQYKFTAMVLFPKEAAFMEVYIQL